MLILGIESSCDETGVALYDTDRGIVGDALFSQIDIHAEYGGVVPELASRDHVRKLLPLIRELCDETQRSLNDVDGVAYTAGPGLAGALMVGAATGRALALGLGVPSLAIHHMEGHLLSPLLADPKPAFPFVALLVSGGHTLLVEVRQLGDYRVVGDTLDDAAGEAFDKTAKMLGLPYPGGPELAKLATSGDATRFRFPRPMTDRPGLDFSFSGLKTHTLTLWNRVEQNDQTRADVAAGFQLAVVETLAIKCRRAMKASGFQSLVVSGGVGANLDLRKKLVAEGARNHWNVYFPPAHLCTDNGAMIAHAGALRLHAGERDDTLAIPVRPRWSLEELTTVATP